MLARLWAWIRVCFSFPVPAEPSGTLSFARNDPMSQALTGRYAARPADPTVPVVKRLGTVSVAGAAPAPFDASQPHEFAINDGETYRITHQDVSAGDVPSETLVLEGIAHDTVTAPAAPAGDLSFSPAPAPAPAPAA